MLISLKSLNKCNFGCHSSLKRKTFGYTSEKNPFNERYWTVTQTGESNCPGSSESTSMCISVQPDSKNNLGCPGEGRSSTVLILMLFIDLRGLLNLTGSFLLHIFHNVIHCVSITLVRACAFTCWLTACYWSHSEINMSLTRKPVTPHRCNKIILVIMCSDDDRNQ